MGNTVLSWVDDWVGVSMLCMSFPSLFYLASNKIPLVSDCYVGEGGRVS